MNDSSILLALSGSEQSQQAAMLAIELAKQMEATLIGQHVVDTRTAWHLLGNDKPGLIGSGPYIAAYESLTESLRGLGYKLMEKFEAVATGQRVAFETNLDEGNPVAEICRRAKDCRLVVMGHQPTGIRTIDEQRAPLVRASVAEGVAHECPTPVLVVQGEYVPWRWLKILVSIEHLNMQFIHAALQLASSLHLPARIVCLATGTHEESPDHIVRDMKLANKELAKIPIDVHVLGGALTDKTSLWTHSPVAVDIDARPDELYVIPTREIGGKRITVFGSTPDLFVRHLTLPNMLLWSEEFAVPQPAAQKEKTATRR